MDRVELLEQLKLKISRENWNNWLTSLEIVTVGDKVVEIALGNIFLKEIVEKKFGLIIRQTISDILDREVDIKFINKVMSDNKSENNKGPMIKNRPLKLSEFNPEFNFDSFVVGESNRMSYFSAMEVAMKPGKYNPLFIYGDVGLGKTHLLHSIANYMLLHSPDLKVKYLTAEDFMNELMNALRSQNMDNFREKFRKNIDVFLIDDVQFLIGKNNAQNELFHTFNSLFNSGKQVVICSDRTPEELATFHPRLVSRFEMGLVVNIQEPDQQTRYQIAKKMAQMISLQLSDDVATYIAKHVDKNLRRLRGAIMNLMIHSKVTGEPVDIESASKIVDSIISMNQNKIKYQSKEVLKSVKINSLINIVIEEFNITKEELYSSSRKKEVANARQILAYCLKNFTKLQVKEISDILKRNHSTVSQSIKKVDQSLLLGNNILKTQIDSLKSYLEKEKLDMV